MKSNKSSNEKGFTLIELMVAMVISLVVMAAVFSTFKSQQDSYIVQSQVSATQQNLRAALFLLSNDIQMAGYCTNSISSSYPFQSSDEIINNVTIRPVIYSRNDEATIAGVKTGTDILVVIKGTDKEVTLSVGDYAVSGDSTTASITLNTPNMLDTADLTYSSSSGNNKYGLLVKKGMNRAELFEVNSANNIIFPSGLIDDYSEGDKIVKVDVIIYKVEDTTSGPTLKRKNLGTDTGYNTIAENVDDLQFDFLDDNNDPLDLTSLTNIRKVRAVKIDIVARTDNKIRGYSGDGYMRRTLSTTIKTRNIGL